MTTDVGGGAGLRLAGPNSAQGLQTDDQVRALTCDEELLCCLGLAFPPLATTDPARIRRIAAELADGFRRLDDVTRAVSVFGSSRLADSHPDYLLAPETARQPGIMEAAGALSIGLNIELVVRAAAQPVRRPGGVVPALLRPQADVCPVRLGVRRLSPQVPHP